jgi:hypothetical protein
VELVRKCWLCDGSDFSTSVRCRKSCRIDSDFWQSFSTKRARGWHDDGAAAALQNRTVEVCVYSTSDAIRKSCYRHIAHLSDFVTLFVKRYPTLHAPTIHCTASFSMDESPIHTFILVHHPKA